MQQSPSYSPDGAAPEAQQKSEVGGDHPGLASAVRQTWGFERGSGKGVPGEGTCAGHSVRAGERAEQTGLASKDRRYGGKQNAS